MLLREIYFVARIVAHVSNFVRILGLLEEFSTEPPKNSNHSPEQDELGGPGGAELSEVEHPRVESEGVGSHSEQALGSRRGRRYDGPGEPAQLQARGESFAVEFRKLFARAARGARS